MAFPAKVGTPAESATTTAGTSHTVNLPTGSAGELLLILGSSVAASTFTQATYTELLDENVARGAWVACRQTDGSEGSTVTVTSSATIKPAFIAYRFSGAENPATQVPELSTVATGTSVNPDATTCTPTGGAKDYKWVSFFTLAGEEADDDTWCTAAPASFSDLRQKTAGTAGTNISAIIASADRDLNAASLDAGAFTTVVSVSNAWRAFTVAIHPTSAAAAPSLPKKVARYGW